MVEIIYTPQLMHIDATDEYRDRYHRAVSLVEDIMSRHPSDKWVIAGGFPRDAMHNREWRDIDVFVDASLCRALKDMGKEDIAEVYGDDDLITQESVVIDGIEVNLVYLLDVSLESVIRRIDIGLCQAALTHDGRLAYTQTCFKDFVLKRLTVTRDTRANHVIKVAKKFPDYRVILGEHELQGDLDGLQDIRLGDDNIRELQAEGQLF